MAADVVGTLWAAIRAAGGVHRPAAAGHAYYRGAYDAQWAAGLALPIDDSAAPGGSVALLADAEVFERPGPAALDAAYAARPRTRVYEDIGRDDPGAWYTVACTHLGRLAGCELSVVCSAFCSAAGDESIGVHHDAWYGAVVQVSGAKQWRTGEGLLGDGPVQQVTTTAGDVLLLPKGLPHVVETPPAPGRSVHLAFAVDRDDDRR